jgi:hypothetical protein
MFTACANKKFNLCESHAHTFCTEHYNLYLTQNTNMCTHSPSCVHCAKCNSHTPCCNVKLCEYHWKRWMRPKCSIPDCDNKSRKVCKNCVSEDRTSNTGFYCNICRSGLCGECKKIFKCLC